MSHDEMTRDTIREAREWSTFVLSFITLVAIPVGIVVLNNQRMSIEKDIATNYVSKTVYIDDRIRSEQERQNMSEQIGRVQGKLEAVLMEQVRISDSISTLKEQLKKQ